MKRSIIIVAVMLSGTAILLCWLYLNNNKPAQQPQQPEPPPAVKNYEPPPPYVPTPEDWERAKYEAQLLNRLPPATIYTMSAASKLCDWVVVGTVEKTGYLFDADSEKINGKYSSAFSQVYWIVLSVDFRLYGKNMGKEMTFVIAENSMSWQPEFFEKRNPKPGDRILVFLTDTYYSISSLYLTTLPGASVRFIDFEKSKAIQPRKGEIYAWTYMTLDDKAAETEAIRAAKAFREFFTGAPKRDREAYHELLCSLLQSPAQRIRDDAERAIKEFYTFDEKGDIDRLLNDDRVRKEMKDYFRFTVRGEKAEEEK